MNRINLLDEQTWNKIAAGEVIERPYSVVKELVENSIDAGAKNITIEIQEGGEKSIKILDDGHGIYPEDIEKAFLPHATSKIKDSEDIFKINTLGFRGEALASIASVSKTTLKSRAPEFSFGTEILIEGGIKSYIKEVGFNIGTYIEVNDLFYNVPARQKFLKSSQRETSLISDITSRLALVNSHISFKLINNGKKVLHTYGSGNPLDVIRSLYGKETVDNLNYFELHSDTTSVYGYIGNAEVSKKSRSRQSIFVNKRYIKSSLITAAVENAFKSFLTINKFPFFVLFLDIYPEFIDVNVHPTKSEIKFSNDREIFKLVFDAVHGAIKNTVKDSLFVNLNEESKSSDTNYENKLKIKDEITQISIPLDLKSPNENVNLTVNESVFKDTINSKENFNYDNTDHNIIYNDKNNTYGNNNTSNNNLDNLKELSNEIPNMKDIITENNYAEDFNKSSLKENTTEGFNNKILLPDFKIIGQFNNSYILTEYNKELYIIDQHAAHEKILFEKYREEISKDNVVVQGLITPIVIDLSSEEFIYYKENENLFKKIGFVTEDFGVNCICIREVPLILGEKNIKALFFDILDNLKNLGTGEIIDVKYNKIATLACKAAVKANNKLSNLEMNALIDELKKINEPFNCPHGRPTIIKITLNELEKRFKRIQ